MTPNAHKSPTAAFMASSSLSAPVSTAVPVRKISASSFLSSITQFYTGSNNAGSVAGISNAEDQTNQQQLSAPGGRTGCSIDGCPGEESFPEIKGRVESKLMSMWHNVKYGWSGKIRSNFSKEQPVWLLGRCYHRKFSPLSSMENSTEMTGSLENHLMAPGVDFMGQQTPEEEPIDAAAADVQEFGTDAIEGELQDGKWEEGIEGFRRDFCSRLWMTYRREFPIMNGSNYTSDCGWGCMLRSGQMLLAQAMIIHFLGRSWRWDPDSQLHSTHEDNVHRKIIRWFGDTPSKNSPFSIHTLVTLGQVTGKRPGDWYGPSSVSHLLKKAVKLASQEHADFDNLYVHVAQDCTVYIQDILDECLVVDPATGPQAAPWQTPLRHRSGGLAAGLAQQSANTHWKAVILLVPLRLGAEKLNPIYGNSLKTLLSTEYCIGIIGGRPKHSLYFVGFQEDKLIHLDPHYCQEVVDVNQENFSAHSFHCKSPRKLKLSKLDPCCCIGFYCASRSDFDNFIASVQPYLLPARISPTGQPSSSPQTSNDYSSYPMFVFSRSRSTDHHSDETPPSAYKMLLRQQLSNGDQSTITSTVEEDEDDETEEFVIL